MNKLSIALRYSGSRLFLVDQLNQKRTLQNGGQKTKDLIKFRFGHPDLGQWKQECKIQRFQSVALHKEHKHL
uniref:Uncharacterized protein n=1 Tax=Arundo donax TaxID=35708 RepID=A0A0A9FB16_ARUDO